MSMNVVVASTITLENANNEATKLEDTQTY